MTMKLVTELTIGGVDTLKTLTTSNNIALVAQTLITTPGVGKPFLIFPSLSGTPTMADFNLHPDWASLGNLVTSTVADNVTMINAMLATPPTDALTF